MYFYALLVMPCSSFEVLEILECILACILGCISHLTLLMQSNMHMQTILICLHTPDSACFSNKRVFS